MRPFRLGMPWMLVAGFLGLGMLVTVIGHVRVGGWFMGFGLFVGAMMRALLPEQYVQDIKVRSRTTDMVGYTALGLVLIVVVMTLKL